jgi:hypothetical protein
LFLESNGIPWRGEHYDYVIQLIIDPRLSGEVALYDVAITIHQSLDVGTTLNAAQEARRAEQDTNQRIAALSTSLKRDGAQDFAECFFDPTSFAQNIEKMFLLASMANDGQAAITLGRAVQVDPRLTPS